MNRHQLQRLLNEYTDSVFIYLPKTLSMQLWLFIYKNTLKGSTLSISSLI